MITVPCKVCGKGIECYESTAHKHVYCSEECKKSVTHITTECINCQKPISIPKSLFGEKRIKIRCCSEECYQQYTDQKEENLQKKCQTLLFKLWKRI